MKIRNGFVSNSSSSSFFAIINNKKETKVTLSLEIDLDSYAREYIKTIDELNFYFKCNYGLKQNEEIDKILKEDEYLKKNYSRMKKAINQGKIILVGNISSEGEVQEQLLYNGKISEIKGIEIFE
jgi:hypothetical protein